MDTETLKDTIKRALPGLLREDPAFRAFILELTRQEYAGRVETEDRFHEVLEELRRDRQEQARKWDEQNRKWDESSKRFEQMHQEIMVQAQKHERSIGALGSRWGIQSEST